MGGTTQEKRLENYYTLYEQIHGSPLISLHDMSLNIGLSRNTVSKYLKEMYTKGIIRGPYLRMKPASTYKEHVYLVNFVNPLKAFRELEQVPHVVYHAATFGDWNTLFITDRLLDISNLKGFESIGYHGVKYLSYTPKVETTTWDESSEKVYEQLHQFMPIRYEHKDRRLTSLDWEDDEWKLFRAFNFMRRKVTPVLQNIHVSYDTYARWIKSLEDHCTIHTEFYPEGYRNYFCHCFLFSTDYEESVKSLISLFPATSSIVELDEQLLVFAYAVSSEERRRLICIICDMKTKKMIKGFRHAVILQQRFN